MEEFSEVLNLEQYYCYNNKKPLKWTLKMVQPWLRKKEEVRRNQSPE